MIRFKKWALGVGSAFVVLWGLNQYLTLRTTLRHHRLRATCAAPASLRLVSALVANNARKWAAADAHAPIATVQVRAAVNNPYTTAVHYSAGSTSCSALATILHVRVAQNPPIVITLQHFRYTLYTDGAQLIANGDLEDLWHKIHHALSVPSAPVP